MQTLLLTLLFVAIAMGAMAVGVMVSGRRLRGSCGGVAGGNCACKAEGRAPGASCPKKAEERPAGPVSRRSLDILPDEPPRR